MRKTRIELLWLSGLVAALLVGGGCTAQSMWPSDRADLVERLIAESPMTAAEKEKVRWWLYWEREYSRESARVRFFPGGVILEADGAVVLSEDGALVALAEMVLAIEDLTGDDCPEVVTVEGFRKPPETRPAYYAYSMTPEPQRLRLLDAPSPKVLLDFDLFDFDGDGTCEVVADVLVGPGGELVSWAEAQSEGVRDGLAVLSLIGGEVQPVLVMAPVPEYRAEWKYGRGQLAVLAKEPGEGEDETPLWLSVVYDSYEKEPFTFQLPSGEAEGETGPVKVYVNTNVPTLPLPRELAKSLRNAETSQEEGDALFAIGTSSWEYEVAFYSKNHTQVGPFGIRASEGEPERVEYIVILWHNGEAIRHSVINEANLLYLSGK